MDNRNWEVIIVNDVSFKIDRTSGCWICTSHKAGTHGYPTTTAGGYCTTLHRKLYMQQTNKRLPRHIQVMHTCDNHMCINPAHLKEGTAAMNMQDAANKIELHTAFAITLQNSMMIKSGILHVVVLLTGSLLINTMSHRQPYGIFVRARRGRESHRR